MNQYVLWQALGRHGEYIFCKAKLIAITICMPTMLFSFWFIHFYVNSIQVVTIFVQYLFQSK